MCDGGHCLGFWLSAPGKIGDEISIIWRDVLTIFRVKQNERRALASNGH